MPSPAQMKAVVATLLDHFHLTIDDYARLTDRQIVELYCHKRNKDGSIEADDGVAVKAPERELTLSEEIHQLDILAGIFNWPAQMVADAKAKLAAKFSSKDAEKHER